MFGIFQGDIETISKDAAEEVPEVEQEARVLKRSRFTRLPVVDNDGRLVGVLNTVLRLVCSFSDLALGVHNFVARLGQ